MGRTSPLASMMGTLSLKVLFLAGIATGVHSAAGADCSSQQASSTSTFWYANMNHVDNAIRPFCPDLDGDVHYMVYKEAFHCGGARAIQRAIDEGTNGALRNPLWMSSQPRVIYVPPGTYDINETIYMRTDTVLMGDATNPPVFRATKNFIGNRVLIDGQDPAANDIKEDSVTVSLKNIVLDTVDIDGGDEFTALSWSVGRGSHLQNVKIVMPSPVNGTGHTGIRLNGGSTLAISDVVVQGGQNGIWHDGDLQALYKGIHFQRNAVGLLISGGFVISLLSPMFVDCMSPIVQNSEIDCWISVVDGISDSSGTLLTLHSVPSVLIENHFTMNPRTTATLFHSEAEFTLPVAPYINRFTYANGVGQDPVYSPNSADSPARPEQVLEPKSPSGNRRRYPAIPAPNYAEEPISSFINIKDPAQNGGHTIRGDNGVDESEALNAILQLAARQNKIAYFPYGKYRVDSTLFIPTGSRIVGEAWATIVGSGSYFQDQKIPRPVVQVGHFGDVGVAHIQDMHFTIADVLVGAIILQFHMKGSQPGDVAIWNSLVTVGGLKGSVNLDYNCRDVNNPCMAAFLGIHFASGSSVYAENVWNWVAHKTVEKHPDEENRGFSIAAGRGVLVDSREGTWLHGLSSEHWWLYQLHLRDAENVVVSLLHSETNWDQGEYAKRLAPAPWTAHAEWQDPDFDWCEEGIKALCRVALANLINGGSNIYTYASASWAFYTGPGMELCGPGITGSNWCQEIMHLVINKPRNLNAFGLCSRAADVALRVNNSTWDYLSWKEYSGGWGGDVGRYTT
ncbi:putative glycoside hydrolase family 55 protein [Podospora conica]|nr:putative glycoside hydrolase family 55 protein [Schizothecium conicum]